MIYARQVLSEKSNVDGDQPVRLSAKLNTEEIEGKQVEMGLDIWEVLERFCPRQTFLLHIRFHLSTRIDKMRVFKTTTNVPANT